MFPLKDKNTQPQVNFLVLIKNNTILRGQPYFTGMKFEQKIWKMTADTRDTQSKCDTLT